MHYPATLPPPSPQPQNQSMNQHDTPVRTRAPGQKIIKYINEKKKTQRLTAGHTSGPQTSHRPRHAKTKQNKKLHIPHFKTQKNITLRGVPGKPAEAEGNAGPSPRAAKFGMPCRCGSSNKDNASNDVVRSMPLPLLLARDERKLSPAPLTVLAAVLATGSCIEYNTHRSQGWRARKKKNDGTHLPLYYWGG